MLNFEWPVFDFSAPIEFAKRMEKPETENQGYRSVFMRDRDRVMYSGSFRRLSGKTQIYLTGTDDNKRNRLTHTLEVSQIARTVSRALGLDCDLTEAIALAHDLGHTPFGHAGEQILHEIMVPNSPISIKDSPLSNPALLDSSAIKESLFGFKHNIQSVRIAATIENNYGNFGLNLTNFTLWGILHHSSTTYKQGKVNTNYLDPDYKNQYNPYYCLLNHPDNEAWSFEAFVVSEADEIAQWHHDLEDALRGGAMSSADVCQAIQKNLQEIMSPEDIANLNKLKKRKRVDKKYSTDLSRIVVNTLVNRLIECSLYNLSQLWKQVGDVANKDKFFLDHKWTEEGIRSAIKLKKIGNQSKLPLETVYPSIISEKIHHSRDVERMNAKGQYIIRKLFQAYYSHPQQLPDSIIAQYMVDMQQYANLTTAEQAGMGAIRVKFENFRSNKVAFGLPEQIMLMRKICDHIAGMTDHYAIEEYNNLYG